jgi:hypothetical protein
MKALSEHLTQLITVAEEYMRRPVHLGSFPPGFAANAAELHRIHSLPAEGMRATRAGVVMCEAIGGFVVEGGEHWQMLIGATLPILRREAYIAFRNERELIRERADGR